MHTRGRTTEVTESRELGLKALILTMETLGLRESGSVRYIILRFLVIFESYSKCGRKYGVRHFDLIKKLLKD
jgi:hypothetical protein